MPPLRAISRLVDSSIAENPRFFFSVMGMPPRKVPLSNRCINRALAKGLLNKYEARVGQRDLEMHFAQCQETNQFMLQERQKIANQDYEVYS
jgi:hypothetical protein